MFFKDMKKNQLVLNRISSKDLQQLEQHLYQIKTTKGIFHVNHVEALELFQQLKPIFGASDDKKRNTKN